MNTKTVLSRSVTSLAAAASLGLTIIACGQSPAPAPVAVPPPGTTNAVGLEQRQLNEKAAKNLVRKWTSQLGPGGALRKGPMALMATPTDETKLPAPQQRALAIKSSANYINPDEIRSANGVLTVKLTANYADNVIGKDPVYLRNFNGKLVGPTLRIKQGEKLRLTLKNDLPGERWLPNMMNTLNSFNTMNLHYHGLHVSPNGIADNVLIQIGPHESQDYEFEIPANHPTGTFWYHPHKHGSTAGDVASGMSGALIIEPKDEKTPSLDNVPEIKAAQEFILVLNQIPYLTDNKLQVPGSNPPVYKTFDYKKGTIEARDADYLFGPGDWTQPGLNRYTTVNGIQVPVFKMRPGEVQRWRIVDSGQRESIHLQIVPAVQAAANAETPGKKAGMMFYEIAADGLALGKMVETPTIELWPGYRSDVLLQAPGEPGEYLLIDAPSNQTITGAPKPLSYVARISVAGEPKPMKLPDPAQLEKLGLGTIKDEELTGNQQARYGILIVGGNVVFTIDGKSFDMETARQLVLGNVEEWTISSINDVGLVTHPFHIHVNPFLVTSIMAPQTDAKGNVVYKNGYPVMIEQLTGGPVWRDTVKIPGGGYVKMRTRYEDFIGTFVQHCHILDHEDQGMMQLIDIVDKNTALASNDASRVPANGTFAPGFTLPDAQGKLHSLTDADGQPAVVFFFKGHGCLHCVQQVTAFTDHYQEFVKKGIRIIGVTSDGTDALKTALEGFPCPFTLLSDPKGVAFAAYGCVKGDGLQHGTFTLDSKRRITWSTTGTSPYIAVRDLLKDSPPATASNNAEQPVEKTQAAVSPAK